MQHFPIPALINADLAHVDDLIRGQLESQQAVLQAAGRYLLAPGRQRLRAACTLLSARLGRNVNPAVLHAAAAVELIQHATHIHNDLISDADRRHGLANARERWSGDVALMVGDYLFALAASEMALAPDARIIDYFSRAVMTITESKLSPVVIMKPFAAAQAQYLAAIGANTAVLFEAACKAGMACGNGSEAEIAQLGRFGYALGMAYAITADVRDVTTNQASLRTAMITLPLIYAVEASGSPDLVAALDMPPTDQAAINELVSEIERAGGSRRALADAEQFVEQAIASLAHLPISDARSALEAIAYSLTAPTRAEP